MGRLNGDRVESIVQLVLDDYAGERADRSLKEGLLAQLLELLGAFRHWKRKQAAIS